MKKIIGRVLMVLPPIALQVVWYYLAIVLLEKVFGGYLSDIVTVVFTILAVLFVVHLVGKRDESSYKLLWAIVIVAFPILGAMLYLTLGHKSTGSKLKKKLTATKLDLTKGRDYKAEEELAKIKADDLRIGQSLEFINDSTGFPVWKNGTSKYYPLGEDMFVDMCEDLKKAQKFVYIEYFIIQRGKFWDTLVDILAERAAHGVDVRVMYDDLGSIATYSAKDIMDLSKRGITCIPFNPFFLIKSQLNNRDHRKIMVIDGVVAYSGGVNLADEYIN
jgi:cardiolipin synthase